MAAVVNRNDPHLAPHFHCHCPQLSRFNERWQQAGHAPRRKRLLRI